MSKAKLFGILLGILILAGCKKDQTTELQLPEAVITSFSIGDTNFSIEKDKILGHTDINIDRSKLVAYFVANGVVKVDTTTQISGTTYNDFSHPIIYTVTTPEGKSHSYEVKYTSFTGLPILYISTTGGAPILSKDVYVEATFRFDPNSADFGVPFTCSGKIKGRGNSTWSFIKKPYKISLSTIQGFFDMTPMKEWVLLANYADKTLMRNYLSMDLSRRLGIAFTPSSHYLEVFLNGTHNGNYLLTDQVDVAPSRVNVETLLNTVTDPSIITGGYLLEVDQRILEAKDEPYFESTKFPIVVKYPKNVSTQQMDYIRNYLIEAENALYGYYFADPQNGFRKYFDEESMIKWFLVSEVFKNVDSKLYSSIYFYKPRNGKLFMGPLWDFDLGAGNANHNPECMISTGWYVRYNPWFSRMYEDPEFKLKVKTMWQKYRSSIYLQVPMLDATIPYLNKSQTLNFMMWGNFADPSWCVVPNLPNYPSHVNYLRTFLKERIDWLDLQFM